MSALVSSVSVTSSRSSRRRPRALTTDRSAGGSSAEKRITAAAIREVLAIPDPARTAGRRILLFDDVCTTGSQLHAVAHCLLREGRAARVRALVLARAPWR